MVWRFPANCCNYNNNHFIVIEILISIVVRITLCKYCIAADWNWSEVPEAFGDIKDEIMIKHALISPIAN